MASDCDDLPCIDIWYISVRQAMAVWDAILVHFRIPFGLLCIRRGREFLRLIWLCRVSSPGPQQNRCRKTSYRRSLVLSRKSELNDEIHRRLGMGWGACDTVPLGISCNTPSYPVGMRPFPSIAMRDIERGDIWCPVWVDRMCTRCTYRNHLVANRDAMMHRPNGIDHQDDIHDSVMSLCHVRPITVSPWQLQR